MIRYLRTGARSQPSRIRPGVTLLGLLATPLTAVALSDASPSQIRFYDSVEVTDTKVRLGDVADLSSLPTPWHALAAQIVVARMPASCDIGALQTAIIARTARLTMPGISPWFRPDANASSNVLIRCSANVAARTKAIPGIAAEKPCMRVLTSLTEGSAIKVTDIDTVPVSCGTGLVHRVAWSRDTHVARAAESLRPGDVIAALPEASLARARRGEPVTFHQSEGSITVSVDSIAPRDEALGHQAAAPQQVGERS